MLTVQGLGLRVQGLGCRVSGSGFRVWGVWLQGSGFSFRFSGFYVRFSVIGISGSLQCHSHIMTRTARHHAKTKNKRGRRGSDALHHAGGNPGANVKSISRRCYLREEACEWELTSETIYLPLGCLQGDFTGQWTKDGVGCLR